MIKNFLLVFFLLAASNNILAAEHGGGEPSEPSESGGAHGGGGAHEEGGEEPKIVEDRSDQIYSSIRVGNFSHIGGVSEINLLLSEIPDIEQEFRDSNILIIGSGKGGIANYLMNKGFSSVTSIDSKEENVNQAKLNYPAMNFKLVTLKDLTNAFEENFFSLVIMIDSAKDEKEKSLLWQKIKNISAEGATLAIIDFTILDTATPNVLTKPNGDSTKPAGDPLYPIEPESTQKFLKFIGWEIIQVKDISPDLLNWYKEMFEDIKSRRNLLEASGILSEEIDLVINYLDHIITLIDEDKIGGAIIIAKKM